MNKCTLLSGHITKNVLQFTAKLVFRRSLEELYMNFVQPIRDKNKLEEMKEQLKKNGTRDFMMFYTGINTGLRISDLVKLNRDDVRNKDGSMKTHITIIEKKTKKLKNFPIMNWLLVEMEKYTRNMQEGEYLFKSQKGDNKPITTTQAYRIIVAAGAEIGLTEIRNPHDA